MESKSCGVLDTPLSRSMTALGEAPRLCFPHNSSPSLRGATCPPQLNERRRKQPSSAASIRLLSQLRVRTAEVGRGGILADLDDAAADGAGAGEMLEQRLAVVAADRAREL